MLLGQSSVTLKYRPGAQHVNADDLSRQCGQCLWPGCSVSSPELRAGDAKLSSELMDQPLASSEMGDSMDADLLPELSGETWVVATYLEEFMADLPPADSEPDFIVASQLDETLIIVRQWVQSGSTPTWSDCSGLSPALRRWRLQFGNLSMDTEGRLWNIFLP